MKPFARSSRHLISFLIFSIALSAQTQDQSAHAQLAALLEREWQYQLQRSPEFATAIGDDRYNDKLSDYSAEAIARQTQHARDALAEFEKIPPQGLSREDQLNRTLAIRGLQMHLAGAPFKWYEMPVDQMNGPHLEYAGLAQDMTFRTAKDYENYHARLEQLPRVLDQLTADMRQGLADRLMPPKYLLEKAAAEILDIANKPLDQSSFVLPLNKFPDAVSPADRERLAKVIHQTIAEKVVPAYKKFGEFVRDEYAPKGRIEDGIWSLPDGAARYKQAIRAMTTTSMDPEELHALGLKQVKDIEAQMLTIAKAQGFADVRSFNAHIQTDPKLRGTSGEQILGLYQHYTDQMYPKLPQFFGKLPQNKLTVVPMEAYRAPNAVPADYSIGAGDGSRPGRINVNEYEPAKRLLLNVEAIAYHEGIPGHHLQFSIAQELKDVPAFRRFANYNAYSEGWALYSESLAHEIGFYQDPYSEYGRLQNLMWRSVRLVVDTGVHWKHWTRQQMIDFFHQHTAMDNQNIETEVDRYIAWPGQALGYKLGEMTILRLRAKAKKELGTSFDLRTFHDAVLGSGPLPLDVLEETVNRWITEQAKRT